MEKIKKGKITGFRGSWGSGLGYLQIQELETGIIKNIPCENAETVRSLEAAFGNVIDKNHSVNPKGGHIGQEIFYSMTAWGTMEAFTPESEASEELVEEYERQKK